VTVVDGPVNGDGGDLRGWSRTQFFHSIYEIYEGPSDPQGPPNAPPVSRLARCKTTAGRSVSGAFYEELQCRSPLAFDQRE
jgi:hypothetical protein